MKTLVIPPAAQRDENSIQMISAWIAEKGLHCTMNVGMWESIGQNEPRAWGIFLADVVRHVSNAVGERTGVSADVTTSEIFESLRAELDDPTSPAKGSFHAGHS
jgi:hypothetical protein